MPEEFDLLIVGGGPAGATAAIYAARYKLKTAVIAKEFGGMVTKTHLIENYPGFKAVSGFELAMKWKEQLEALKVEIIQDEATGIQKNKSFRLSLKSGRQVEGKTLLLALGTERRKLNIPGEDKYFGKGVSYCATCDGPLFAGKVVGVVGGADSACKEALLLTEYAEKVYIIYRKEKLRCEPMTFDQLNANKKIEIIYNANVIELSGNNFLDKAKLDDGRDLKLEGLFIEAGSMPNTYLIKALGIETDANGYIKADSEQRTNVPKVYAAGDITTAKLRQIITACGQGAMAALSAYNDLKSGK